MSATNLIAQWNKMTIMRRTIGAVSRSPLRFAGASVFVLSFASATYNRPLFDKRDDKNGPNRSKASFCSDNHVFSRADTPIFLSIAKSISIGATTLAIRLFMNSYGEYKVVDDQHYAHFLSLVLGDSGRSDNNQSLITVSNHRSLFDDPGVVSLVLPLWIGLQPKYNRYGICSQEYCFADILPSFIKGYIGAGQVLPIWRGGGIEQALLKDFGKLIAMGEWCHIFPEGGVWQKDELGGRGRAYGEGVEQDFSKSKLRWGIGKLIAHAPVRPRVVPFAHVGMENLLPQHPDTGKTGLKKDIFGGEKLSVKVRFGREIFFDDLIEEHEKIYGDLWVLDGKGKCSYSKGYISSKEERELYRKIALRIENEMEELTKSVVVGSRSR